MLCVLNVLWQKRLDIAFDVTLTDAAGDVTRHVTCVTMVANWRLKKVPIWSPQLAAGVFVGGCYCTRAF